MQIAHLFQKQWLKYWLYVVKIFLVWNIYVIFVSITLLTNDINKVRGLKKQELYFSWYLFPIIIKSLAIFFYFIVMAYITGNWFLILIKLPFCNDVRGHSFWHNWLGWRNYLPLPLKSMKEMVITAQLIWQLR